VCACMCVFVCVCVCVCVFASLKTLCRHSPPLVREREREKECVFVCACSLKDSLQAYTTSGVCVCVTLQRTGSFMSVRTFCVHFKEFGPHATHCNTLQHTATTLQHTATHCNTLQHTATHCNALQRAGSLMLVRTLGRFVTYCNTLQHPATSCNTLQHTATHCNTQDY